LTIYFTRPTRLQYLKSLASAIAEIF